MAAFEKKKKIIVLNFHSSEIFLVAVFLPSQAKRVGRYERISARYVCRCAREEEGWELWKNRFSTLRSCPWEARKHLHKLFSRHLLFLAGLGGGSAQAPVFRQLRNKNGAMLEK